LTVHHPEYPLQCRPIRGQKSPLCRRICQFQTSRVSGIHLYARIVVTASTMVGPMKLPSLYGPSRTRFLPSKWILPPSSDTDPIRSDTRLLAAGEIKGPRSAPGSNPPSTLSPFALSTSSGSHELVVPTKTAAQQCQ